MEEKTHFIDPLLEKVGEYGKTSFELLKLKTLDKTVTIISAFATKSIVSFFFFMFLIVTTIGIALWIGDLLGKFYYGFFLVAGFYGIVTIILHVFIKNRIKKSIGNSIISHILN